MDNSDLIVSRDRLLDKTTKDGKVRMMADKVPS